MQLSSLSTANLREAAKALRSNAASASASRAQAGILKYFIVEPNMSIYDRIDDLISEIERLRSSVHIGKKET